MSVRRGHFALVGLALAGVVVAAACFSEHSTPTTPTTPTTPGTAPATAAVDVGDIFFKSAHNGQSNPAVDTVAVNGAVTWTWATGEALAHSVQSLGSPSFTSSGVLSGAGNTYQFTFTAPGSYNYNCVIHGNLMTGTIVVLAAAASDSTPIPTPSTPTTSTPLE
jgi:plastocyanin